MGTALVIVESPAKARTIEKYLGEGFRVEASVGHVRDLPGNASEIPPGMKGQSWARLGVNVDSAFEPIYVVPPAKKAQVRLLKDALKDADALYLATDEDREGESIAWHLLEVLKPKVPVRRLVFNEITKTAIQKALANPREVDLHLVRAQETRRVLDRLYGYEVSPLLWKKIRRGLSAGRVQSVAVRLVVERERRRMVFKPGAWWDVKTTFSHPQGVFEAEMMSLNGQRLASGRDYGEDGKLIEGRDVLVMDEATARGVVASIEGKDAKIVSMDERPYSDRPAAPFTTSTLQQEANRKLRWTARRAMGAAQSLYENGWITYMRTDSTTLSSEAIEAARTLIQEQFGKAYLPDKPRVYKNKSKNAQEAHEAVRPAGQRFRSLEEAEAQLDGDTLRLYELIWKRTVACQMEDAKGRTLKVTLDVEGASFAARGRTLEFPGYRRAYVEGSDDPEAAIADQERLLPKMQVGEDATVVDPEPKGHETKPPARLTEATLVKELEARGIGRPSTYASIIDTVQRRRYVFKKGSALVPTFTAFAVTALLEQHLSWLVDYGFTAAMEDQLDGIALGQEEYLSFLVRFYRGDTGLKDRLADAGDKIDPRTVCTIPLAMEEKDGTKIELRVGRYGPFLSAGDVRADLPKDLAPDELTLEMAQELLEKRAEGPRVLGVKEGTDEPVSIQIGPYGPYVQLGEVVEIIGPRGGKKKSKPPRSSLLRGMVAEEVDLDIALKLLSLPRDLGKNPEGDEPVLAANGRFGPYVKSGTQSRSIPREMSVLDITLEQALELLAAPARRQGREPIKVLGPDPATERQLRVMDGRFGPYVTDGETNATLPREMDPEALSIDEAVALIRKKEAAPPRPKRGAAAKKPAAKKPAAKKPAAKKTAAKKPAAKKTAAKKPAAKKPAAKKATAAKKPAAKKPAAKKPAAKKATTAAKKPAAKKPAAKKPAAKKPAAKKAAASKTPPAEGEAKSSA